MTSGAAAALLHNDTAMISVANRVIAVGYITFSLRCGEQNGQNRAGVKYWEIIADNLHKAGWSLGWVSALDLEGRTIWIVDAHGYGKRFILQAEEIQTAFLEAERAIHQFAVSLIS